MLKQDPKDPGVLLGMLVEVLIIVILITVIILKHYKNCFSKIRRWFF